MVNTTKINYKLIYYFIYSGDGNGFGVSSLGTEMSSLEPQMSSMFNDISLPPSLKAFTTAFQPGMSAGSLKTMSGIDNSLQSSSLFGLSNSLGFELPSLNHAKTEDSTRGMSTKLMNFQHEQMMSLPKSNDLQLQTPLIREAGSGSSTPSAISVSSLRNSMCRTSSVDSQLAVLRNEMVCTDFFNICIQHGQIIYQIAT